MLDKKSADNKVDVQSIECLARLFTVMGQKLQNEASANEGNKRMFENSFSSFQKLASGMPFSLKSGCLKFSEGFIFTFSFYQIIVWKFYKF